MNAPNTASTPKPLKILLADDSANIHRAVALALRKTQFELIYCDNGQDAWRIIQEHRPAVVLADLDMPGPNGKELCIKVKGSASLANVKVILLCGSFDQIEDQKLDALAADGRLWKPFESHVLLSLLSTVLKAPLHKPAEKTLVESQSPTLQSPMPPPPPPPTLPKPPIAKVTKPVVHESAEKTMPLTPFETSDPIRELTNEMTRETFNSEPISELPPPSVESWRLPQDHEPMVTKKVEETESLPRDISPFERTLPPEEVPAPYDFGVKNSDPLPEVSPSQSSLSNDDLWTPSAESGEQFARDEKSIASDLSHFRDSSFNVAPKNIEIPSESDAPTISIDRSEFAAPPLPRAPAPTLPNIPPVKSYAEAAAPNTGLDAQTLRKLVHEEIHRAFDQWFKEKLEKKLQEVLSEIDDD